MKRLSSLLALLLALLILLSACQEAPPITNSETESSSETESQRSETESDPPVWKEQTLNILDNSPSIFLPVGRTYGRDDALACDNSCTGIRFVAECEGSVSIYAKSILRPGFPKIYFTLYINGERIDTRFTVTEELEWITLAEDLPKATYEFELVKQSQYHMGTAELLEVNLTGIFHKAPEQRSLFIEYYGDSIVNGSNVHKGAKTNEETSDATLAYGWLSAQALDADCSIVGRGGLSLSVETEMDIMDDLFDICGSSLHSDVPKYDFARTPDVVVVNMGCNDGVKAASVDAFKERVAELITNIREKYGDDIRIVWIYGYRNDAKEYWEHIQEVMENMGGEYGNLYACQVSVCYIPKSEGGDGYHPDVANAAIMAEEVTDFLRNLLND